MPPNKPVLWVSENAYAEMLKLAQHHYPLETGGMLMGYEAEDSTVVVTKIIGPGPNAKHGRFRFIPDGVYQQSELENHFWATDGRETYLEALAKPFYEAPGDDSAGELEEAEVDVGAFLVTDA